MKYHEQYEILKEKHPELLSEIVGDCREINEDINQRYRDKIR